MRYIIMLITSFAVLIIDFFIKKKEKRNILRKKREPTSYIKLLSKKLDLKKYKKYIRIYKILKNINMNYTVELFYVYKLCIVIFSIILTLIFSIINKKLNINVSEINIFIKLIVVIFVVWSLPNILIKIFSYIKLCLSNKEILILQTYTIILIKAGKNVKQILNSLYKRANYFKDNLRIALKNYSTDPYEALMNLKKSSDSNDFKKIIIALEQCLYSNRDTSLIFLYNSRKMTKEMSRLYKLKKDGKKKIFNTLMLILPLTAWAIVSGYPWLVYVLKCINNIPM